ncbi:hypothetical protein [Nocardia brasiliensis]|uniref:hypothetical protein n=1 Tax=Nocardia brasiliensis TaxID=37326 RepID=UPI0004A6E9BD|nr:hypothetical protein [Nocardia brasiliensis]
MGSTNVAGFALVSLVAAAGWGLTLPGHGDADRRAAGAPEVVLVRDDGDMAADNPADAITDEQLRDVRLCTSAEEEAAQTPEAVEACAAKRATSAAGRFESAPLEKYREFEATVPFEMKGDVGAAPDTRKETFGLGSSYLDNTKAALVAVCAHTAATGGPCGEPEDDICRDSEPSSSEAMSKKGLSDYLAEKRRRLCGTGADSDLTTELREAKHAALNAFRGARTLGGSLADRVAADKAEAFAVLKWRAAGWL